MSQTDPSGSTPKKQGLVRVLTALAGIPLVLGGAYLGGAWFASLILIVGLLSQFEIARMLAKAGLKPFLMVALLVGAILPLRHWIPNWEAAVVLILVGMFGAIPFVNGQKLPQRISATLLIIIYPVWMITFLSDLRLGMHIDLPDELLKRLTLLFFLLIWASDTLAYYAGRILGTHPFFAAISPKKTWEGFFGGLAGVVVVAVGAKLAGLVDLSWNNVAALSLICGLGGPIGDLVESKLKRSFEVKDSGSILPGHGGVLDRFDAAILCAPLAWLYVAYVW